MKHTAGPWTIGSEQNWSVDRYAKNAEWARVRDKNGGLIAKVESVNPKGKRQSCDFDIEAANARLISACPEMLEALKHIYDYSAKQFEANSDERALWAQINKIASNAIAKVEGK